MKSSSIWWFLSTSFMLSAAAIVLLKIEGYRSWAAFSALCMFISLYFFAKAQKEEEPETKENEE